MELKDEVEGKNIKIIIIKMNREREKGNESR